MDQLKDTMLSSFIVFENEMNGERSTPLHKIRQEAMSRFEETGFPTKRQEEWKYTNLRPALKHNFKVFHKIDDGLEYKDIKRFLLNETDTYKIVFVNGVYSSWLSDTTHNNYDVCTFGAALSKYRDVVDTHFSTIAPKDEPMVDLNTAFAREGAFIRVPKGKIVEKPIQMVFFSTESSNEVLTQPRNLIVVGENAQVQIVERHQNLSEKPSFTNSVTEVFADKNALVDYYKVQNDNLHANLVDNTYAKQLTGSNVNVRTFSFGGNITRNNLQFFLSQPHCESHMNGITLIGKTQLVDHHTLADHQAPQCESHELYKGIYDEKSTGVFNGKIIVHVDAQKTNAFQSSNNILLDEKASINAKPQLEIFADDVKCSHGCTVGQLDQEALFYLQARGIPKKEGKALLMYAFCNEIMEDVKIPELKRKVNTQIAKKLGVDIDFAL